MIRKVESRLGFELWGFVVAGALIYDWVCGLEHEELKFDVCIKSSVRIRM